MPALHEEDRKALLEDGALPPDSSAKDRFCVMCPVKRGSLRLLPCCLCHNWCHIGCSYQTHLGRVCPCHVQILDPKWSPASWLNLLLEKHAWLSAGLVWMHRASESGIEGVFEESGPTGLEPRPTINLFEQWEEGAHLPKLVNARNYSFPKRLVVVYTWLYGPCL